jgi:hypothetical protein
MDCDEFEVLSARAAGHCEACGTPAEKTGRGNLIIDHDHRYGWDAVRGLICSSCNSQLSVLENYRSFKDLQADQRFEEYLSRAWFMEVARLGRSRGAVMDPPSDAERRFVEFVLRSRFVKPLTRLIGRQPAVTIHTHVTPGPVRYTVRVSYVSATPCRYKVALRLSCLNKRQFEVESVSVTAAGFVSQWFEAVPDAVRFLGPKLAIDRWVRPELEEQRQDVRKAIPAQRTDD